MARFAEVALSSGLRQTLSYRVPAAYADTLTRGMRVVVPLGRREATGYVVELSGERPPHERLRDIVRPEPPERLVPDSILDLTRWVANYYLAPWGQALDAAIPPNVRRSGTRDRRRKAEQAKETGPTVESTAGAAAMAGTVSTPEAREDAGTHPSPDGPERSDVEEMYRLPALDVPELFPEQASACSEVVAALEQEQSETFLLHGVTGSGKTEVYLRLAEHVVRAGGQVLFLVPEIAMGAQIVARVRARFGKAVGLYHSQAGAKQRREVWNGGRLGTLPIVVGARSAVFIPMPRLRLVVVDEEHESAYKQEETPRYHGRDVAVYRGHRARAVVVLGSATPSLESHQNAESGKYRRLLLRERIDSRPPPSVVVVDMTEEGEEPEGLGASGRGAGGASHPAPPVFSSVLVGKIRERIDRREQTILFLNRRGHSTTVQCGDCGTAIKCGQCDVVLTYHQPERRLRCHYCNASRPEPTHCEQCLSAHFFYSGYGTQRIEEALEELFPDARIVRMDRDATRRRGAHGDVVRAMESGEVDILLGTQMVAKGFDFPKVTLVGVLQADQEILMPDFRASERGFQVLTQVAGRSGRGTLGGEVVFQTMMPESYVIAAASREDYSGFAVEEMLIRKEVGYPPFRHIVHLLIDGVREVQVQDRAEALCAALNEWIEEKRIPVRLLGPAPMPLSKLKGQYRWHLAVISESRPALHRVARVALALKAPRGLSRTRVQADVDPVSML